MKKIIILLLALIMITFTGCDVLEVVVEILEIAIEANEEINESEQAQETDGEIAQELVISSDDAPQLPEMDFAQSDFFDDGYEEVGFVRVSDGDTVTFLMGGVNVKCRFVGINTPETAKSDKPAEAYANEAMDFTEKVLQNASVIVLERDDSAGTYDKYDRLLAWVWADGELLAAKLISKGYANTRYLRNHYLHADYIFELEESAQEMTVGIWNE